MEISRANDWNRCKESNKIRLQNPSLLFFHKKQIISFSYQLSISFTNGLQHYRFLGKTNFYEVFGKYQDRIGRFSWSKNDSNYLDVKHKVFKKDDIEVFRQVQKFTTGEADFNQFMQLTNQLVNAAKKFAREENLTPVLIPRMSKDMDEQLKLAHKVVDIVDRANRKICVTLLRHKLDKPESFYVQVQLSARKKEDRSFNNLSMWNINSKNLSIEMRYWIRYMMRFLLINPFVMLHKK